MLKLRPAGSELVAPDRINSGGSSLAAVAGKADVGVEALWRRRKTAIKIGNTLRGDP